MIQNQSERTVGPQEGIHRAVGQEQELDVRAAIELSRRTYFWRCPGCGHAIRWRAGETDAVGFCMVHHLVHVHGIAIEQIIAAEPALAGEVRAYQRQMKLERGPRWCESCE